MLDMSFPPQLIQLYCIVCTASRQPELKQPISYSTGSLVSDQERSHTGSLQSLFISIQNLCRTVNKESINNITVKYCNVKVACKIVNHIFRTSNWPIDDTESQQIVHQLHQLHFEVSYIYSEVYLVGLHLPQPTRYAICVTIAHNKFFITNFRIQLSELVNWTELHHSSSNSS